MENIFQLPTPIVSKFPPLMDLHCRPRQINPACWSLTDRQERIAWWNQKRIHGSRVLLAGAGGLGGNQAKIFVQMGMGNIDIVDPDLVEDSNRNRQMFTAEDVGKPKAHRVIENLLPYAVHSTKLRGYFMTFEKWATEYADVYDAICCGVDSLPTMVAAAAYGLRTKTTVIFTNVSEDGEGCRIFIQRPAPTEPCFVCYKPAAMGYPRSRDKACVPVAAIADILHVAIGFGARATVGEILQTPIGAYNCRDITFTGFDIKKDVKKRANCPLCQSLERVC